MKKDYRVKKNKEFSLIFKHGKSVANRQFVLYVLPKDDQSHFRLGLSVSKKIGNAVTRNRVKRLIRELFSQFEGDLIQQNDYLVIARKPTADMDFHEVKKSLVHLFRRAKVYNS